MAGASAPHCRPGPVHTGHVGLLGIEGIEQETVLGRGAFGVVYRAWQPTLQRHVAVKVLIGAFDEPALRRFERECATVGSLSEQPGILTVHAAGRTAEGSPYLVMPYLPGGSLADRLKEGPLPPADVVAVGIAVGGALSVAHARNVLHLDVKPGNILLDGQGRPQLVDFGIARFIDAEQRGHTATVAGTPGFAAPEIFDGRQPTVRSDIYGLGATLHALAAGRTPFTLSAAGGLSGLLHQIANEDPPDLRPHGVPDPLASVVDRAMAKDPDERFPTMDELVNALEGVQLDAGWASDDRPHAALPQPIGVIASGDAEPETLDEARIAPHRASSAAPLTRAGLGEVTITPRPSTDPTDRTDPVDGPSVVPITATGSDEAEPPEDDAAPGRRGQRRMAGVVAVGITLVAVTVAAVTFAGSGGRAQPIPPAEAPTTEPVAVTEGPGLGELQEWLGEVRSFENVVPFAAVEGTGVLCEEELAQLDERFGPAPTAAGPVIPEGLDDPLAAQPEEARSLWSENIDATMRRLHRCAAGDLTTEEDETFRDRMEEARLALRDFYAGTAPSPSSAEP